MQSLIRTYIISNELPEFAILIPEKLDTINAAVFFTSAGKIDVIEEQFLAYVVYIENREFLLAQSGQGAHTLLTRMKELMKKKITKFLFVNKAYTLNEKKSIGNIYLIKKSVLSSSGKSVSVETELMKSLQKQIPIKTGSNLSIDIDTLFFKKNTEKNKKEYSKYDTLSIGDYYFLKFIKHYKLSGAVINYVSGDVLQEKARDNKKYFDKVMNLIVEFLVRGH